jgi:hypothetical protein
VAERHLLDIEQRSSSNAAVDAAAMLVSGFRRGESTLTDTYRRSPRTV